MFQENREDYLIENLLLFNNRNDQTQYFKL